MKLDKVKSKNKKKKGKRIGRGGKRGTHCGKGMKGQISRSGRRFSPNIRELIKRYPKLRGYRNMSRTEDTVCVNLDVLEKKFEAEGKVTPQALLEKGIIRRIEGENPRVKILGRGELKKALFFEDCAVSKSAKEKIEKAGGKIGVSK